MPAFTSRYLVALSVILCSAATAAARGAADLGAYRWKPIRPTAPSDPDMWAPRAGLRALELKNELYAMGGRGAFSFAAPTPLYGDVWTSDDLGASWTKLAEWDDAAEAAGTMWSPRAYFGAVTHRGRMYVMGGQNFETAPNPLFPDGCAFLPPEAPCLPIVPTSTFFNDVWSSKDGRAWERVASSAPWEGRAGLSAVAHHGAMYVMGGSRGDDASTGGTGRVLYNDVWRSKDGKEWERIAESAGWTPRAGGVVVSMGGYMYLLGGERGFTCGFDPTSQCQPATETLYFNDVWRSKDGGEWELITESAGWSPRPGHQCVAMLNQMVCFGGYGEIPGVPPVFANPTDIWTSRDGETWTELGQPASPPWNGAVEDMKYDFWALLVSGNGKGQSPSIVTFGGDRERFGLPDDANARLLDNDVWILSSEGKADDAENQVSSLKSKVDHSDPVKKQAASGGTASSKITLALGYGFVLVWYLWT